MAWINTHFFYSISEKKTWCAQSVQKGWWNILQPVWTTVDQLIKLQEWTIKPFAEAHYNEPVKRQSSDNWKYDSN